MRHIAEFVAVLACSLFAGAAIYINLAEHPASSTAIAVANSGAEESGLGQCPSK
jgi:hypothetical protein